MNINYKNRQVATTDELTIEELYDHFIPFSDVGLKFQRNYIPPSKKDINAFNQNLVEGRIHQNLTLVRTEDCYEHDNDPRWLKCKKYLVLDGQHRLGMVETTLTEDLLESPHLGIYQKSKIPARIISGMNYDDLGNTFVANNCGKPVTDQDILTFLDTPMSNFIVEFVEKNYKILGRIFSNATMRNEGRKIDKEVRISAQLLSAIPKYMYSYSGFPTGKSFYQTVKPEQVKQSLEAWVKLLNEIPNDNRRKSRAVGCRMLVSLLDRDNLQIKNYSELYKKFERWETEEYNNESKLIELSDNSRTTRLYKELCSSHSKREISTRLDHIKRDFILCNKIELTRLGILI